jgi:mannosylglycerate hydrolase
VSTSFDHSGRDRRLRAMFPLGVRADSTAAECAFGLVTRSGAEGGPAEPALATFPSRRFVTAGPLTVTHRGLLEYELVGDGPDRSALVLTLMRAVGILSRPAPPARPNVAGPAIPLRDTQIPGYQTFRYAIARGCEDPWALADRVWTPLAAVRSIGDGPLADRGRRLGLSGARVSSLRRHEGALEVRVFNPADQPTEVSIPGHEGTLVDLRGQVVDTWRGSFPLAPWSLATARLSAATLDD